MLLKTPLNAAHRESGAKMVPFGGWDMPVEYAGLISEHMAVRTAAGLFDVSHMGELTVEGPGALAFLQGATSNDVSKLVDGQAQYSSLPMENGAPVDDIVVLRRAADRYLIVRERRQHREGLPLALRARARRIARSRTVATTTRCSRCRARARSRSCRD